MPLDHYITLGRSGLRVSPFCLGTMTFGEDLGWGSSVEESQQIIDRFIGFGGNFIDTANFYTRGHSEKIIGDHVGRHSARRDRLVIATKFSGNLYPGDPNGGGSGRKSLINACENSLRRLQTDYIDLYWLHIWDANTPIEETMAALDDLVAAGKVRYIGSSSYSASQIVEAQWVSRGRNLARFVTEQPPYSILVRGIEEDVLPTVQRHGMGTLVYSPLSGGWLTGRWRKGAPGTPTSAARPGARFDMSTPANQRKLDVVEELAQLAEKSGMTMIELALAWAINHPGVTSAIIGPRTMEQLESQLPSVRVTLDTEILDRVDELVAPGVTLNADDNSYGAAELTPQARRR